MIPLANLEAQAREIWPEVEQEIQALILNARFIGGKEVREFEEAFAKEVETRYCVSVGNGTDALELILEAMGVGPGDEVIVPGLTYVATVEAVVRTGAIAVVVDVDDNLVLHSGRIADAITARTKAVIAVHLHGYPAAVGQLKSQLPDSIALIEDAAQAHGTVVEGSPAGSHGLAAGFSFFPSKGLGAWGDAGAVTTDDSNLADRIRLLANHGRIDKNSHSLPGRNSRLDALQALVLGAKLERIGEWRSRRQKVADSYVEHLSDLEWLTLPSKTVHGAHGWHQFVVRLKSRDEMRAFLADVGIETGIHYPYAIPDLPYPNLRVLDGCPNARAAASSMLSLPMNPHITGDEVKSVVDSVRTFGVARQGRRFSDD